MSSNDNEKSVLMMIKELHETIPAIVREAHSFSSKHRDIVEQSGACACFHCFEAFSPSEIQDWIDDGQTALCPKCGVDSVLPSAAGYPLDYDFLMEIHEHWF